MIDKSMRKEFKKGEKKGDDYQSHDHLVMRWLRKVEEMKERKKVWLFTGISRQLYIYIYTCVCVFT